MSWQHIKAGETPTDNYGSILVSNLLNDPGHPDISVAVVKVTGEQTTGRDTASNLLYYVLEGEGRFYVEDQTVEVGVGDLISIKKNTYYRDEGNLTLLAIATPRFDREARERLEE